MQQPKRPTGGMLMAVRKIQKGENGYTPNQINPQFKAYNAIQTTSNNYDNRMLSKTQFPKSQRKAEQFLNAQNYRANHSESYNVSKASLPNQDAFSKKPKVSETYSVSEVKQTKPAITIKSQNDTVLDRMTSHLNNFQGFPTEILQFLQKGDMTTFLTEYQKFNRNNSTKIKDLKEYFFTQQNFYKNLKLIISGGCDSSAFYKDQSFNFFEDIPQIFNKILVEVSNRLKSFESFKDGNKKYFSSNTNKKIEDNFEKFIKAISLLKADRDKGVDEMKAVRNQLARKNNEVTDLKEKVADLQLKLEMLNHEQGEKSQSTTLKRKLEKSEDSEWRLKSQLRQLQTQHEYQTLELQQYKSKSQNLNDENNKLKYDIKELVSKIQRQEKKIYQLSSEVETLQMQLQQVKITQNQSFKVNSMTDSNQIKALKMQLQDKKREIDDKKRLISQLRTNQEEYQQAISQLQSRSRQQSLSEKEDQSKYYLESSWLLQYKDTTEKSRLITMIKDYCYCQPLQFKLLYKYQKFQQPNFHDYIDNKQNFLILIRLVNNNVIGGFCPFPLAKNQKPNGGFIFNLTSNSLYPLKEGKACYIYDEFYLTLGNAQIRIRMSDKVVYSSFGIQNEHFQSGNHTIGHFFSGCDSKSNQRQMQFIGYEVYEVKLFD